MKKIDILGNYIKKCDIRNKENGDYELLGVSMKKEFMPSVANIIDTDLSNYKVITKNIFACNPMHVGRDMVLPVAMYEKETKALVSPAFFTFKTKDENVLRSKYIKLIFSLKSTDEYLCFKTDSSVRGGISWEDICSIKFNYVPVDAQDKIIDAYERIISEINMIKKNNNLLFNLSKELFIKMFVKYQDKDISKEMVDSEFGDIPSNFEIKKVDELDLDISDGNYSSKYPTDSEFVSTGIPFIRGVDFEDYCISKDNLNYITEEKHKELQKGHLKENDLLITTRGDIGRIAFIQNCFIDSNINAQLIRFNGKNKYGRVFLYNLFSSEFVQNEIKSSTTGTALQQLPVNVFKNLKVIVPKDKKIIKKYDSKTDFIFNEIESNLELIDNYKEVLNELLPIII